MLRVLLIGLLVLTACAGQSPAPLPLPSEMREETLALPELLSEPQRWSGRRITLVAPALLRDELRLLTLPNTTDPPDEAALWLADAVPDAVSRQLDDGAGFLKLRGRLSPSGAFGRDQRYAYEFIAEEIGVLEPERTTIANLADNPLAIDGVLLTVTGTLLLRDDSALLVDRVSAGGVPEAEARQIKLPRSAVGASTAAGFKSSGDVGWGAVRVTGWWQNAALAPFAVEPQAD